VRTTWVLGDGASAHEVRGVFGGRGLMSATASVGGEVVAVFRRVEGSRSLTGWGGVVWREGMFSCYSVPSPQCEFQR
jgi:hypothetical protein